MSTEMKYRKATHLIAKGANIVEALKTAEISSPAYYYWKSKNKPPPKIAKRKQRASKLGALVALPETPVTNKVVGFVGSPESVLAAVRGML